MAAVVLISSVIFLLSTCVAEEINAPEKLLKPRNFNPHPYDNNEVLLSKFYKHLSAPEPTKQGPVLFPNDGPPPPRPPLIVTSRPLSESISRSELNPTPEPVNNTEAQPSYLSRIQIGRPNYAPINFYKQQYDFQTNPVSEYSAQNTEYSTQNSDYGAQSGEYQRKYGLVDPKSALDSALRALNKYPAYVPNNKNPLEYVVNKPEYDITYPKVEYGNKLDYGHKNQKQEYGHQNAYQEYGHQNANQEYVLKNANQEHGRQNVNEVYGAVKTPALNYAPINFYKNNVNLDVNHLDADDYGSYDEGKDYRHPYANLVKKSRLQNAVEDNRYNDYEERTVLPPIYKALSDHARQKVLNIQAKTTLAPPQPQDLPRPEHYQKKESHSDYNDYSNELKDTEYGKKYAFSYSVRDHKTGDDFSHSQRSSGAATNGEYRVRLPDGRMQIVSYTADEGGYKADVRYAEDDDKTTENNKLDNEIPSQSNAYKPVKPQQNFNSKEDYYYDSREFYNDAESSNKVDQPKQNFRPIVVSEYSFNKDNAVNYKVTTPYDNSILITPTKRQFHVQSTTQRPFHSVGSTPTYSYNSIPVEINVPSTTPVPNFSYRPQSYTTTERVVNIGNMKSPLLHTNIQNNGDSLHNRYHLSKLSVSSTIAPFSYKSSLAPHFSASTVSPFNNEQGTNFISRFNKYLSYH